MSKRGVVWLSLIVVIITMFYSLTPMLAEQDSVYRTYARLIEVDALVHREFVRTIDSTNLVDGAIRGMVLELDRYSAYVAPGEMAAFESRNTGTYVGIGVEIGVVNNAITVIAPIEHSPAMTAGVRAGDVILAINGVRTKSMSVYDVEQLLTGEPGAEVTVRWRGAGGEVVERRIARDAVNRPRVRGVSHKPDGSSRFMIDGEHRIGYIRVSHFSRGMMNDFDLALQEVISNQAAGLVIDLRFNPGGLFPEAVDMVDRFLSTGTIVKTVTRRRAVDTYTAASGRTVGDLPLVVLVNGGSASSSEIVAGSLQDHARALIVGERTFGKGSVQQLILMQGGRAGLRLTVACYQLPSGRIIHKSPENAETDDWGVIPDVVVDLDAGEYDEIIRRRSEVDRNIAANSDADFGVFIDRQIQTAIDHLVSTLQ